MPKHPPTDDDSPDDPVAPATESFEQFYSKNRSRYVRRLSRDLSSTDEADDLAQDVLVAVWLAQRVRKIRDFCAVVERAINNARVDRWRKRNARRTYEAQLAHEYEVLQGVPPRIESDALQAELGRLLLELWQEHPDACEAYILRRYQGLEFQQIADVMGIGRNRASKLVWIALIKLNSVRGGRGYPMSALNTRIVHAPEIPVRRLLGDPRRGGAGELLFQLDGWRVVPSRPREFERILIRG